MTEAERRTGAILAWVALGLAAASFVLRLSGFSAHAGMEARIREILSPLGIVLLALGLIVRQRSSRAANIFFWLSIAVLLPTIVLLLRSVFAG
jgi:hypothetical protein